ncbi:hypothetical protein F5Y03DRAFT_373717 [Xylaria venustula]|nr:hypothetical protein F5Y03DRAFT_373717 [Xylaria venustula]
MSSLGDANSPGRAALSLRLSCDRCRAQKLKCSVPEGSGACQRCTRAKIPCVFGRRTSSRRASRRHGHPAAQTSPTTDAHTNLSAPHPLPALTQPTSEQHPAVLPATASSTTPTSSITSPDPLEIALDLELCSCDDQPFCDNFAPLASSFDAANLASFDSICDWSQFHNNKTEAELFSVTKSSRVTDLVNPESWSMDTTATSDIIGTYNLTMLVAQIQHQLRNLEEGPWGDADTERGLNDYPIGAIFELSQQFSAVAGPILGKFAFTDAVREDDNNTKTPDDNVSSRTGDTPSILLVMCGYMWLINIYSVMLEHFEGYLYRMPASQKPTLGVTSSLISSVSRIGAIGPSPAFRLGDLPCAQAALGMQQIHTAVCMVLDVLREIEAHVGGEALVARNMAVTLLLSNSSRQQEGSGVDLGKKATAVKELLREKMGL